MFARILAALFLAALIGCSSTQPVPAPQPVNDPDQAGPVTGGELFNGNY